MVKRSQYLGGRRRGLRESMARSDQPMKCIATIWGRRRSRVSQGVLIMVILIVEDDFLIGWTLKLVLALAGHRALERFHAERG